MLRLQLLSLCPYRSARLNSAPSDPCPCTLLPLPSLLHGRCLAVASSAAAIALLLHIFLQMHYVRSVAASNQRAFDIVAAKKRAERAAMMEERQRQVLVREQEAAAAAAAAAAHEVEIRRQYTALRQELRIPEVVPDRHMLLPSMERKIEEMKLEKAQLQQLRQQQQVANALRSQQQQQAALAAAELDAQKPKPAARQVQHDGDIVLLRVCHARYRCRLFRSTGPLTSSRFSQAAAA